MSDWHYTGVPRQVGNGDPQWRVTYTDAESASGVAPQCPRQNDITSEHYDVLAGVFDEYGVYDCCPHPHLQCFNEPQASEVARFLTERYVWLCD